MGAKRIMLEPHVPRAEVKDVDEHDQARKRDKANKRSQKRRKKFEIEPEARAGDALGGDDREELEVEHVERLNEDCERGGPSHEWEAGDRAEALRVAQADLSERRCDVEVPVRAGRAGVRPNA